VHHAQLVPRRHVPAQSMQGLHLLFQPPSGFIASSHHHRRMHMLRAFPCEFVNPSSVCLRLL
jgi:hypothetical protein